MAAISSPGSRPGMSASTSPSASRTGASNQLSERNAEAPRHHPGNAARAYGDCGDGQAKHCEARHLAQRKVGNESARQTEPAHGRAHKDVEFGGNRQTGWLHGGSPEIVQAISASIRNTV